MSLTREQLIVQAYEDAPEVWRCAMSHTDLPLDWAGKCQMLYPDEPDHSLCGPVRLVVALGESDQ